MSAGREALTSAVVLMNGKRWREAALGLSGAADRLIAEGRTSDADRALGLLVQCAAGWRREMWNRPGGRTEVR